VTLPNYPRQPVTRQSREKYHQQIPEDHLAALAQRIRAAMDLL
jgi:hypothetical protein